MNAKKRTKFAALLLLGLCGSGSAQGQALAGVNALKALYDHTTAIHLDASLTIWRRLDSGAEAQGAGTFSYWAQGDRYRVDCVVDPKLQVLPSLTYAYDGTTLGVLHHDTAVLRLFSRDTGTQPTAAPNPFFLPVAFLAQRFAGCGNCVGMKLQEAKRAPGWQRLLELGSKNSAGNLELVVPVRDSLADIVEHRLRFAGPAGQPVLESVTVRHRSDVHSVYSFDDYRPVAQSALRFPHRLVVEDWAAGKKVARLEYKIERLDLWPTFPEGVFTVDPDRATRVWDEDAARLLKSGGR
jgi:hypothetical protein